MDTDIDAPQRSDITYAAVFAGALGSAAVALLFLGMDGFRGDILYTPSLLGSVLALGVSPSEVAPVRLDMVALYSVLHLFAFTSVGAVASLVHAMPTREGRSLPALAGGIMAILGLGVVLTDAVLLPGIAQNIGVVPLLLANALAAAIMAWFIHTTLQQSGWGRLASTMAPAPPVAGSSAIPVTP